VPRIGIENTLFPIPNLSPMTAPALPTVGLAAAERYEQAGRHSSSSALARPGRRPCAHRQSASMAAAPSKPTRQSATGLFAGRTGALTRWAKPAVVASAPGGSALPV